VWNWPVHVVRSEHAGRERTVVDYNGCHGFVY